MFSLKFLSTNDVTEKSCVLYEAICNIKGEDNQDNFCERINLGRNSEVFETMRILGERIFEWDTEVRGTWNGLLVFALLDVVEFDDFVRVGDRLQAGDTESAMLLLAELRRKRLVPTDHLTRSSEE